MTMNTVPVRIQIDRYSTLSELMKAVHFSEADSLKHSFLGLSHIQKLVESSGQRLFNSLLVYQQSSPVSNNSVFERLDLGIDSMDEYPLGLEISEGDSEIAYHLRYDQKLMDQSQAQRFLEYLNTMLAVAIDKPALPLSEIPTISSVDEILFRQYGFGPKVDFPPEQCLQHRFEKTCLDYPNHIAIESENGSITYQELNNVANGLAKRLVGMKITNTLVGLITDRSIGMVVAILAILKV
jgi:non-ribosomal peptide synthetase component F